jgi:hypothetical protein
VGQRERQREPRERLVLPVATLICGMWVLSGVIALVQGDALIFQIVSGPFVLMCGYVFGIKLARGKEEE